jgi:hypothetical protein
MKRNTVLLSCFLLWLVSCAQFHGERMEGVKPGMEKADVLRILGETKDVMVYDDIEVLRYRENTGWWVYEYYYVRLVGGKVESFGMERADERVTDTDPPLRVPR